MTSHTETLGPFAVDVARPLPAEVRVRAARAAQAAALAAIPPEYSPSVAPAPTAPRKAPQAAPLLPTPEQVAAMVCLNRRGVETVRQLWGHIRRSRSRAPWTFRDLATGANLPATTVAYWIPILADAGLLDYQPGVFRGIRLAEGRAQ